MMNNLIRVTANLKVAKKNPIQIRSEIISISEIQQNP